MKQDFAERYFFTAAFSSIKERQRLALKKKKIKTLRFIFQTASSSGDPHVHIIKQVKATDEGLYTCIAGNVLGQATASAYLEVNSARSLMSSGAMQPLLFLLLLLLIAQNKLWINRLTMPRHSSTIRSWTNCQFNQLCDPKIDKTKNWRSVFRTKWRGWKKSLGRHNQAYVFM